MTATPHSAASTPVHPPIDAETALRYAVGPMVPMERLELLHFLGYPETLPNSPVERVIMVNARIVADTKADIWDEAFDWSTDMFAMPVDHYNPYREV
jgi:hypothetical protein